MQTVTEYLNHFIELTVIAITLITAVILLTLAKDLI